jgi:hypothetical protein
MSKKQTRWEKAKKLTVELRDLIKNANKEEFRNIIDEGILDDILSSILDATEVKNHKTIGDFFEQNRDRLVTIATLRYAITNNYSFKSSKANNVFVSPSNVQFYEDGIMFTEGAQFEGILGLRRAGETKYAVAARDAKPDEMLGKDDLTFLTKEDYNQLRKRIIIEDVNALEKPFLELKSMLDEKIDDEAKYQEFLHKYPWILSAQHEEIQRHTKLGTEDIPDFTGVRIRDRCRDVFEIKQPFLELFLKDGDFSSDFNKSWNQAQRYLAYAIRNSQHLLSEKKLRFENPRCYLIAGFDLSDDQIQKIRREKEFHTPAIEFITFNQLLTYTEKTISFLKNLKDVANKPPNPTQ